MFFHSVMMQQWLPFRKMFREYLYLNRAPKENVYSTRYLRRLGNDHYIQNTQSYSPTRPKKIRDPNYRNWRRGLEEPVANLPGISESYPFGYSIANHERFFPTLAGYTPTPDPNHQLLVQGLGPAPIFNTPYVFH